MARPTARSKAQAEFRSLIFPQGMDIQGELTVKPIETSTERAHRHRMEVREFWVKEAPVHLVAIAIVVVGTVVSIVITFRPSSTFEERKWGVAIMANLLVAVAGFAFGKAAK